MDGITGVSGVALGVLRGARVAQKQTKYIPESGSACVVRSRVNSW